MTKQDKTLAKKRGRPATGIGQTIGVRIHEDQLAAIDAWAEQQRPPLKSRPAAIRLLIDKALGR
ncbi:hypothetical protein [Brevundimonas naejangsanensis]|uniref:hypothetical protein n=1 Tax=Brevundimonas naejangsanensis TaxID=588932 RepID=UPI0026F01687|nr:hypothetical protein [Brevundimonas naejangsanensis]